MNDRHQIVVLDGNRWIHVGRDCRHELDVDAFGEPAVSAGDTVANAALAIWLWMDWKNAGYPGRVAVIRNINGVGVWIGDEDNPMPAKVALYEWGMATNVQISPRRWWAN